MNDLKDVINTKLLSRMDFKNMQRYAIERPCKNILDYIKTTDFDTNTVYNALYNAFDTIYMELPLMTIGRSLYFISQQKFTKKIYIFSEEYDKKIEFDIKENYMTISASSEVGKMSENIVISLEGKDLSIAFNSKFLTECIKVIDDEFINLYFNTKINPCVIKPYYGDDYLYLILPLRINA